MDTAAAIGFLVGSAVLAYGAPIADELLRGSNSLPSWLGKAFSPPSSTEQVDAIRTKSKESKAFIEGVVIEVTTLYGKVGALAAEARTAENAEAAKVNVKDAYHATERALEALNRIRNSAFDQVNSIEAILTSATAANVPEKESAQRLDEARIALQVLIRFVRDAETYQKYVVEILKPFIPTDSLVVGSFGTVHETLPTFEQLMSEAPPKSPSLLRIFISKRVSVMSYLRNGDLMNGSPALPEDSTDTKKPYEGVLAQGRRMQTYIRNYLTVISKSYSRTSRAGMQDAENDARELKRDITECNNMNPRKFTAEIEFAIQRNNQQEIDRIVNELGSQLLKLQSFRLQLEKLEWDYKSYVSRLPEALKNEFSAMPMQANVVADAKELNLETLRDFRLNLDNDEEFREDALQVLEFLSREARRQYEENIRKLTEGRTDEARLEILSRLREV